MIKNMLHKLDADGYALGWVVGISTTLITTLFYIGATLIRPEDSQYAASSAIIGFIFSPIILSIYLNALAFLVGYDKPVGCGLVTELDNDDDGHSGE